MKTILFLILTSSIYAFDPNTVLDENGNIDKDKFMAVVNDPNKVEAEKPKPEKEPIYFPIGEYWLKESKTITEVQWYPIKEEVYSEEGERIQWEWRGRNRWIPTKSGDFKWIDMQSQGYLTEATFEFEKAKYEIFGEFRIKVTRQVKRGLGWDMNDDGRIDLLDFALWAEGWPETIE